MLSLFILFILIFLVIAYFSKKETSDVLNKDKNSNESEETNSNIDSFICKDFITPSLARREELKKLLDSNFTKEDKKYLFKLFENKCYKCGSKNHLEVDHHVPLTIAYPLKENKKYNSVILCKNCNRKKADSLPQEFYTKQELKILENKYNIKSHIDIDTDRIKKINKILISEKLLLLRKAIENKTSVSFIYIEMSENKVFHDKQFIQAKPIKIYENMQFYINSKKKFYFLEAENIKSNKIEHFELMFIIDLKVDKNKQ